MGDEWKIFYYQYEGGQDFFLIIILIHIQYTFLQTHIKKTPSPLARTVVHVLYNDNEPLVKIWGTVHFEIFEI